MIVKLKMPLDSTFLSQLIYDGVLYILNYVPQSSFDLNEARLPDDFLCRAYQTMSDKRVEEISIMLTGNDKIEKFFESLGIKERPSKKTYREVLKLLKELCKNISINRDMVTIQAEMKGRNVFLDIPERCNLAAPQLFKVDRYTGFSTLEMNTTSQQLGLRTSPIVILIGLLGVYSSHIITVRTLESIYHYFLFLSPDEIIRLFAAGDRGRLISIYMIKEELRDLLSKVLRSSVISEVLVLEVMLNTKIISELKSKNLDKVSLNLFRISPEGMTYKIYETVPLSVYQDPMFHYILSKQGIKADVLCEKLQQALSPDGVIMEALRSFNTANKYSEADVVLRGVLDLYRFVTLAEIPGFFRFLRSLEEARRILGEDVRTQKRAKRYAHILKDISYVF